MISVSVSASVLGFYGRFLSPFTLTQGVPAQKVAWENSCLLTGSFPSTPTTVTRQLGSLKQSGETLGRMRDREVTHVNVSGSVSVLGDTYFDSTNAYGFPQAKRVTGDFVQFDDVVAWGEPWQELKTASYANYYDNSSGRWRSMAESSVETIATFSGDKLVIATKGKRGEIRRVDTGQILQATTYYGYMHMFRADPKTRRIYSHSYVSRSGATAASWYTSGEISAALTTIPTSGGSAWDLLSDLIRRSIGASSAIADEVVGMIDIARKGAYLGLDQHPTDFGDLALEVSKQVKFVEQNVLGLLFDIEDPRRFRLLWKNLVNSRGWRKALRAYRRDIPHGGKAQAQQIIDLFKPASASYLFGLYAVLPTSRDAERLLQGAMRSSMFQLQQRLHSRRVTSIDIPDSISAQHTAVLTVQCAEYPNHISGWANRLRDLWKNPDHISDWAQEGIGGVKRWGVFPEMTNLWDLLPYSFVADWFIQFGSLFDDVNKYMDQEHYFPIHHCVMSEKWERGVSMAVLLPQLAATGSVVFSYYTRWISSELPLPTITLSTESTAGIHSLEASALILQRLR